MSKSSFHLASDDIYRRVQFSGLIDALRRMHQETPAEVRDMLLDQPGVEGTDYSLIRAAWQKGSAIGVKVANIFPGNRHSDPPAIHAAYVLFDGETGVPTRSIDGTALTYLKTAADSALGSRLLARPDSKNMLMVGAGAMAPYLIEAHHCACPELSSVRVWNRSKDRRDELVRALEDRYAISAVDDLSDAVAWADLISCATMTTEPLLRGDWLKEGVHVDLVGAYRLDMREADDSTLRRARLFVDSRNTTIKEIGELTIPIAAGVIKESDVLADLYDLCSG
ncbi:MAG: ornithine cyclodeaminase, partial [Arenicellales bacterium]